MMNIFIHRIDSLTLSLATFIGMIVMVWLGRMAEKIWRKEDAEPKGGLGSLQAAVFALFGFILAFTFSISASRFENVRNIMVNEANDIGTAILRADLYPDSVRDVFLSDFKEYVETRIKLYSDIYDTALVLQLRGKMSLIAEKIWARTMQQSRLPNMMIPTNNMVPALNSMIDIATTRHVMLLARVPDLIVYMLLILSLASSFIAGFTSSNVRPKDWIIIAGFALLSSMVIYITLDLGRPLRGFIRTQVGETAIIELREMFNH